MQLSEDVLVISHQVLPRQQSAVGTNQKWQWRAGPREPRAGRAAGSGRGAAGRLWVSLRSALPNMLRGTRILTLICLLWCNSLPYYTLRYFESFLIGIPHAQWNSITGTLVKAIYIYYRINNYTLSWIKKQTINCAPTVHELYLWRECFVIYVHFQNYVHTLSSSQGMPPSRRLTV